MQITMYIAHHAHLAPQLSGDFAVGWDGLAVRRSGSSTGAIFPQAAIRCGNRVLNVSEIDGRVDQVISLAKRISYTGGAPIASCWGDRING